jgi:type F conjugative transfer system protein TrbI
MWTIPSNKRLSAVLGLLGGLLLSSLKGNCTPLKLKDQPPLAPGVTWKGVKEKAVKRGNYALPTGFTFEAVLEGAVFSYNLLTPAVAVLEDDVTYNGELVIPKKSRLVGVVGVVHSLDRINIDFRSCVFPDGEEIRIDGMALSMDGSAGVKGKVEKHNDTLAAKVAMRTIATGVEAGAAMSTPSIGNAMASDLTQQASQSLDTTNVKDLESIYVEERAPIKIFLKQRTEY